SGTIARLYDLNITRAELEETLAGIANQRLFPLRNHARMISLYEIYDRYDIAEVLNGNRVMKCMEEEIEYAVQKRWIEPQKNIHG
ncbi:MAG: hypothetical protein HUJ58_04285, partial [Erysipelotrichaceae bacterium]|nr:hypothetical protein [Erysipelotrichaceae bacterium]